jgi:hypothetical protein
METAMTTATLPLSATAGAAAHSHKGWFQRFIDRAVEARMRQAEAEIRRHFRHLGPDLVEQMNHKDAVGKNWTLPFVRGA